MAPGYIQLQLHDMRGMRWRLLSHCQQGFRWMPPVGNRPRSSCARWSSSCSRSSSNRQARIAALEARVSQNSRNSDRPPSSDPPFVTNLLPLPRRGLQERSRDILGIAKPCWRPRRSSGSRLTPVPVGSRSFPTTTTYYTHQVIELPEIQMQVTHVVLHEACCPQCGRLLKAPLPEEHRYGYGPRLTALIGELSGGQRDSRTAVQEFCASVLGVPISRGGIQRAVDRVSEAIRPHDEAIARQARERRSTI